MPPEKDKREPPWGEPPWKIDFVPRRQSVPDSADFAIIGAGFTGLAAAAWLRHLAPEKSVVVFEAARIGAGASGHTGGMTLAETAAGDLRGLGDVLAGLQRILGEFRIDCDLALPGAFEIGRSKGLADSPIRWNDSGALRVVNRVPGGTLDPGKLVAGLARAAEERQTILAENHPVTKIEWKSHPVIHAAGTQCAAEKILFATNALALDLSSLAGRAEAKLTLAILTEPLALAQLEAIGLADGNPFYTVDLPYLWGRLCRDGGVIFGAGLVDAENEAGVSNESGLEHLDITQGRAKELFESIERRIRSLHPALHGIGFTRRWGGPILFRDNWQPVFMRHPMSSEAVVLGAYAGHGVALSVYLGAWAAEVLLGRRELPPWGSIRR